MKLAIITAAAAVTISACAKPPSCGSFADQQAAIEAAGQVIDRDAIPYDKFTEGQSQIEYVRSPSAPDGWHDRNGYLNRQAVEAFVHSPHDGQKKRFTEWF